MHGLQTDGVIGPQTMKWLNTSVTERLALLALNAERIRLWPTQQDSMIVVNVPGFDMKYWDAYREVFESKVVVGKTTRPTICDEYQTRFTDHQSNLECAA